MSGNAAVLPYYDDRLSTVIAGPVPERALARVQYRQLLDLLAGAAPTLATQEDAASAGIFSSDQMVSGLTRLHQLSTRMTIEQEKDALSELHKPLTSPALLNYLFSKKSTRDGALQKSHFTHEQWLSMQSLFGSSARSYLQDKGVFASGNGANAAITDEEDFIGSSSSSQSDIADDVLILSADADISESNIQSNAPKNSGIRLSKIKSRDIQGEEIRPDALDSGGNTAVKGRNISDLVARIENFTKAGNRSNTNGEAVSLLPLEELDALQQTGRQLEFQTDKDGVIVAASHSNFVGVKLFMAAEDAGWGCDQATCRRFLNKMAIRRGIIIVPGQMGGQKYIDAQPEFDENGRYCGYKAVIFPDPHQCLAEQSAKPSDDDERSDHYRQLIHELRTPVGALKGFAEILQSQLFGPVSKQYREMATMILEDSELLLSHFEHLKHFEQKSETSAQPAAVKLIDVAEQLKTAMISAAPNAQICLNLQQGHHLYIAYEMASGLKFWAESHANGLAGEISVSFMISKMEDRIHAVFTNGRYAANDKNSGKNEDKRNFALSLAHARLLDAGAKIESDSEKTIIDLPVMPVINSQQLG
jgi:hypothetical protein